MWPPLQKVRFSDSHFKEMFPGLEVSSLIYQLLIFPSDPTYVVAPVLESRSGREDLKKLFAGSITFPNTIIIAVVSFFFFFFFVAFENELVSFPWF
jgi:hypothetical protein